MAHSWIGKTLRGRYKVEALLGQGGMSAVYRATDPNLRRTVAIKLIHPHLSENPNFVNRFKEEATAVARLRHPNIVQVHDFNSDGETYYMVMEYLIGETLQARISRLNAVNRYMAFNEAIGFCHQICDAVQYAHNHELIHRDIKPANIMLDLNGQAILMDFGIVKIIGGEYHTATGATVGTAAYMSPEQIRGERTEEASDIYSLGVTLYEMLSGRTPYQADSALTLMMMVLNEPLPDLHDIRKGIPTALSDVVEKALAKNKKDRFQSMEEMATALKNTESHIVKFAPAITVADDVQMAKKPDPNMLVGTLDIGEKLSSDLGYSEIVIEEEPASKTPATERSVVNDRFSAVPTVIDPPVDQLPASQPVVASKGRAAVRPKRSWVIAFAVILLLIAISAAAVIIIQIRKAPDLLITPLDSSLGLINDQSAQFVVNMGRWETNANIEDLAYGPDGSLIGTASNREPNPLAKYRFFGAIFRTDAGTNQHYLLGHKGLIYSVEFSPDGELFGTASDDGSVILWKISDGTRSQMIETEMGGLSSLDFSSSHPLLAAGSWNGVISFWQLSDGHLLRSLQGHEDGVLDITFSPDGKIVASASEDHSIKLWQVSDGSLLHNLTGHTAAVRGLAFSPDGVWLASASDDQTIAIWGVEDGGMTRSLKGHSEPVLDVDFSKDGSVVASGSGDGTLRLWRMSDGNLLNLLSEDLDSVTSIAFSPDGKTLVSGERDGVIRFWGLSEAIPQGN